MDGSRMEGKHLVATMDDGEEVIEVFDKDETCERCGARGAYVIDGDSAVVGLCIECLRRAFKKVVEEDDINAPRP